MKKIIILLAILCSVLPALTQKNDFVLHDIRLPQQFNQQIITSLEQDKSGLLWFVTNNGLYRYDGNDIIHLGPNSNPAIPHTDFTTLYTDRQNNLWIGAKNGLTRLDLNTWVSTEIKQKSGTPSLSKHILTVSQGRNGTIYAGSLDGKLYQIVGDSLNLIFDINQSLPNLYDLPNITYIEEPIANQLWLGTSIGLIHIQIKKDGSYGAPTYFGRDLFKGEQLSSAMFGPTGKCLLIVPTRGLYSFNTKDGVFKKIQGKYGDLGKSGQVFLAPLTRTEALLMTNSPAIGKQKLLIYNFQKDTVVEQDLQFPSYLKDNHIVWFSHTGSMILLSLNEHLMELTPSTTPFSSLMAEPKSLNSIRAIYKQPGTKLYVGSYKDGFVSMNEKSGEKEIIARKYVYCILPWNKDSLLLSTEGDGLLWYEPQKKKLTTLKIPPDRTDGKPIGKFITFLLRHDKDHVLVGTYERLYMVDLYKKSAKSVRGDLLFRTRILSILKRDNNYFIATENGILKWNSLTDSMIDFPSHSTSLFQNKIAVYGMANVGNQIWAGTDGKGILILDDQGNITDSIGLADGLAADIVFTLTATNKYVLAGTKNGLSVIDKKSGKINNYSTLDQLPANEFNSAATFQYGDTVYLGTINGVVRFNTGQLRDVKNEKRFDPLYITDLTFANHQGEMVHDYTWPYHQKKEVHIPAKTQYFSLDFGSMGELSQNLNYYYRLQEDHAWNLLGASKKITFVGMSPDQYQLQIAARLPDGKWTDLLMSVPLTVAAAFYQTLWFKLLVGLFLIIIGWLILKYREKQRDKERLLRLQIAGDLHDEVGSTLAGISMQAEMLLGGHYVHMKEYLQNIADNGRLAVQTMGDIVWSIDSRNDDSVSLFQRMERYGEKIFGVTDITIVFHSEGFNEKQHISQKVRQNSMLIFKEALTNILKHANASRVDITFTSLNKGFKLAIADDGKGLSDDQIVRFKQNPNGHGLRNIQMRTDAIGAKLEYPAVEKGVMIVLIVNR